MNSSKVLHDVQQLNLMDKRNNKRLKFVGGRGGRRSFGNGRSNNAPSGKWDHDMYKGGNGNSNNGR